MKKLPRRSPELMIGPDGTTVEPQPELWCTPTPKLYDLSPLDAIKLKGGIDSSEFSLWRYRTALPFEARSSRWRFMTLGEGATPLVQVSPRYPSLRIKVEYAMPTLSFKDRGAVVMLTKAADWKVEHIVTDTSGNAGTALAAYAARARMTCDIFVPSTASSGKLIQMERHGAILHKINGSREAAAMEAQEFVATRRAFYANHAYNPYFHEGTKTFAYELWEQLGFRAPDSLFLPVGHGTLLLGAFKGFVELRNAGLIDKLPVFHAVQATTCAPLAEAFAASSSRPSTVESDTTVAEGVAVAKPPRGRQILEAVHLTGGDIVAIDDGDTLDARLELASMGYFVEPTAAIPFAAYRQHAEWARTTAEDNKITVVPLCGAGLKAPHA